MENKGYLLILLTAAISGFSIFLNKFGISFSDPCIFTFLKNFLVAVLVTSIILILGEYKNFKLLKLKQWIFLMIIGLIGGSIPFLLFFKGLSIISSAEASFIQKTMFIWIFALATFFLKEKISVQQVIAGAALLFGNLILLKNFELDLSGGSALVFMATIMWAFENVLAKHLLKKISSKIVIWARMFFGSVFIFIFLFLNNQLGELKIIDRDQIMWIIITSLLLFGYVFTWYSGLKYIKVTEAAVMLMLGAPITTLLNSLHSGHINSNELEGILIVFISVVIFLVSEKIMTNAKELSILKE